MSTAALPVNVALVDDTGKIDGQHLAQVAAALNEQVQSDFAPIWKVRATVQAFPQAPPHTWAIVVQNQLDQAGALGYHTNDANQPVSYVQYTDEWPITASHELLEMLADPWGNRMHSAQLPLGLEGSFAQFGLKSSTDRVHYLLEVADPCEATSYPVGGVALSDFLLPAWYRSAPGPHLTYSHAGGCARQRQVAEGGYVSFSGPDGTWWQVMCNQKQLQISNLGKFSREIHNSIREFTDFHARVART